MKFRQAAAFLLLALAQVSQASVIDMGPPQDALGHWEFDLYDALGLQRGTSTNPLFFGLVNGSNQLSINSLGQAAVSFPADVMPASQNITTKDLATATATGANAQPIVIGTPTAGSAASFAVTSAATAKVVVTGIWSISGGALVVEQGFAAGSIWVPVGLHQTGTAYTQSSFTSNFVGGQNLSGASNIRVRATGTMTGTAVVTVTLSNNANSVYIANGLTIQDSTTPSQKLGITFDNYAKTRMDATSLFYDTFDVALDTTTRWTATGTSPTSAAGQLTVSAGTTALAFSALASQPTFQLLGNMYSQALAIIQVDSSLKMGAYRFAGLGIQAASPTVAAPIQDGVGFGWDSATGILSGDVWSNSVKTKTVSLSSSQQTDGTFHRYVVYYKTSVVYFEIDNVMVGSITYPNPQLSILPYLNLVVNGASTVSPAATFINSFAGVGDTSRTNQFLSDGTFPWRKATVKPPSTAPASTDTTHVVGLNPVSTLPAGTNLLGKMGFDQTTPGTTNRVSLPDGVVAISGSPTVQGLGTAGTPSGGVSSVQGVSNGQPLPVTATTPTALSGNAPATVSVGVASGALVAINASRKGLVVTNNSSAIVSLAFGANAAVLSSGITLKPGGVWDMDQFTFTTQAVNAIAASAASGVSYQEFQ